jgi:cytidylate kinase
LIIAVDGPAGSGKSTVAKLVADRLGILYLDTGAMYRAFAMYVLENGAPLEDLETIRKLLQTFSIQIKDNRIEVNGRDVTRDIRSERVNEQVSYLSSLRPVREKMVELQRRLGDNTDLIAEGRDIGTVVFPHAAHKFYLDADIDERARRRLHDENSGHLAGSVQEMKEKLLSRDAYDSGRKLSPLRKAEDAEYTDTTRMTIDQVCTLIVQRVQES